ncbi:hypothetical protein M758_UG145000 [Ceratodon purpureus]|nr:hypothetical protein M758_UG145000 [Ceratodon purpureus]
MCCGRRPHERRSSPDPHIVARPHPFFSLPRYGHSSPCASSDLSLAASRRLRTAARSASGGFCSAMSRVYVGNLDPRATKRVLEDEFRVYGVLRGVWVGCKPPGFAFIEF